MFEISMTSALFIYVICYALGFLFMTVLYYFIDKNEHDYKYYLLFFTLGFIGALLMCLRDIVGVFAGVILSNSIFVLGFMMLPIGYKRMVKFEVGKIFYHIVIALFVVSFLVFTYVFNNTIIRVYIMNFTLVVIVVDMLYNLFKYKNHGNEVMILSVILILLSIILRTLNMVINTEETHQFLMFVYDPFYIVLAGVSNLFIIPGVLLISKSKLEVILKDMINLDSLTGLENRRSMISKFSNVWRQSQRNKVPISVFMIDIDDFKKFNDQFGHIFGDNILISISNSIKRIIYRPFDIICRFGGEEFVVVLFECDYESALLKAQQIHDEVKKCEIYLDENQSSPLTVSIGIVSVIAENELNIDELLNLADRQMYESKNKGKNQTSITKL